MAVKAGVYGGRTHDERRRDRRARLLEATLEVWGRPGAGPVTMTRICSAAGLSERYFYEQFANLEAALTAVLESVAADIERESLAAFESTRGEPHERVKAGIGAFVRVLTDDPRKGQVAMVESVGVPALRGRRDELLRGFVALTAREARALHGPTAWAEAEGLLAATMFIGGVAQLVTAWLDGTLETTPADVVDAAVHLFEAIAHR
jgi:AcrR family transcriptional regulator